MNRLHPLRSLAVAATTAVALVLVGCAGSAAPTRSPSAEDGPSGTITVYTSEPQDKADEIIAAFREEHPDVTVTLFRAATGDLSARIAAEQKTGGVKADILWAADSGTFDGYADQGLFAKFTPDAAADLREEVVDPKGFYVGTRIIPTVIAYNTTQIESPPKSWAALGDAKYKGELVVPNPQVSGAAAYNAAVWYGMDDLGEDWFDELGDNDTVMADSNGPVSQAVAGGTQPVGIVVDYLVRDLAKQGSPIAVAYPSEGVPYVSEPMGIFRSSKNRAAAEAFEEFVLSEAGQKLAVRQNYLPVRADVGTPKGAPALDRLKTLTPDPADVAATRDEAVTAFTSALGG